MKRLLILTAGLLLLSACATMDRSECKTADWRTIGLEDGAAGRLQSYIGNHRKACARYQITPDLSQYQLGHSQGLQSFCTASKGFSQGRRGWRYNGVCPKPLEPDFMTGYAQGLHIHELETEVNRLRALLRQSEQEIATLTASIGDKEEMLVSNGISEQQRRDLLQSIKADQLRLDQLNSERLIQRGQHTRANDNLQHALAAY